MPGDRPPSVAPFKSGVWTASDTHLSVHDRKTVAGAFRRERHRVPNQLAMWFFRKPSERMIRDFLEHQKHEPFSYRELGFSQSKTPAGYDLDHNRFCLGKSRPVFESACEALKRWEMFPPPWTAIEPKSAPIREGTVVAVLMHVVGLWWLNAARIVYVFDEREPVRRFGFAYGTLTGHVERGEERFSIEWLGDDTVWYDIRAFSRPRYWVVRLGYILARRLQRRFVLDSRASMLRAVAHVAAPPAPSRAS